MDHSYNLEQLLQPSRTGLRLLVGLHWIESALQLLTLCIAYLILGLNLEYLWLLVVISTFVVWNIYSTWYLFNTSDHQVSEIDLCLQLLIETLILTLLLFLTGGVTSPFAALYLLPLALAASLLTPRYTIVLMILAMGAYTSLFYFYEAEPMAHHGSNNFFQHVVGMWLSNFIGALVLVTFVTSLSRLARRHREVLGEMREQSLIDAHVTALGGVAAGAAHSLATPMSTVALLIDESIDDLNNAEETSVDVLAKVREQVTTQLQLARQQMLECRTRLDELVDSSKNSFETQYQFDDIMQFVHATTERWMLIRPDFQLEIEVSDAVINQSELVKIDNALTYCLSTLLDNAADASHSVGRDEVILKISRIDSDLRFEVTDMGDGPEDQWMPFESAKDGGMGIGLAIVKSTMARLNGHFGFNKGSGSCTAWMQLPIYSEPNQS